MSKYERKYFDHYKIRSRYLPFSHGEKPWYYRGWKKLLKRNFKERPQFIVDVGCGLGMGAIHWATFGKTILVDISADALKEAHDKGRGDVWVIGNAEDLCVSSNSISVLVAFDLVEHLDCPEKFFSEAYRVLAKGGIIALTTPNPDSFGARRKKNEWFGWQDDTHINIRSYTEWERLLKEYNFEIIQKGTSTLWDLPYWIKVPTILQKTILIPLNILIELIHGPILPWKYGENLMVIAKKIK